MKIFFLVYFSSLLLYAHPHTFIDVYLNMSVENSKSSTLHVEWQIDEMTSAMLIMDTDLDGDNNYNEQESLRVKQEYFETLSDYDYYTFLFVDGKKIALPKPTNFQVEIKNSKICYKFDLEYDYNSRSFYYEFGDSDMYSAMVLKDEFVAVDGAIAKVTGVDNDFYYGYRFEVK